MEMGSGRTSSTGPCSFSNATAQRKTGCTPQDSLYAIYSLPFDMQTRIEQQHSKRNLHELYIILGAKGRRRGRGELPKQYRQLSPGPLPRAVYVEYEVARAATFRQILGFLDFKAYVHINTALKIGLHQFPISKNPKYRRGK